MTVRSQPLFPPVPEATVAAVQAAFPKGNLYVDLRAEFGTLYEDQLLADLYPPFGRPVEVAPWRMALVVVMQYIEGHCQINCRAKNTLHSAGISSGSEALTSHFGVKYGLKMTSTSHSTALFCRSNR